jgi:hypothetical protein
VFLCVSIKVVTRSKAWTVFARSNPGIVSSNPTRRHGYLCAFILCLCCSVYRWWPWDGLIPRPRSPTVCELLIWNRIRGLGAEWAGRATEKKVSQKWRSYIRKFLLSILLLLLSFLPLLYYYYYYYSLQLYVHPVAVDLTLGSNLTLGSRPYTGQ